MRGQAGPSDAAMLLGEVSGARVDTASTLAALSGLRFSEGRVAGPEASITWRLGCNARLAVVDKASWTSHHDDVLVEALRVLSALGGLPAGPVSSDPESWVNILATLRSLRELLRSTPPLPSDQPHRAGRSVPGPRHECRPGYAPASCCRQCLLKWLNVRTDIWVSASQEALRASQEAAVLSQWRLPGPFVASSSPLPANSPLHPSPAAFARALPATAVPVAGAPTPGRLAREASAYRLASPPPPRPTSALSSPAVNLHMAPATPRTAGTARSSVSSPHISGGRTPGASPGLGGTTPSSFLAYHPVGVGCPSCRFFSDEAEALQAALEDAESALLALKEELADTERRVVAELGGAARLAQAQATGLAAELAEAVAALEVARGGKAVPDHHHVSMPIGAQSVMGVAAVVFAFVVGAAAGKRAERKANA